jgi:aspartate 1-decarboxylase
MKTHRKMLGAKIHRAVVTHADVNYEGSITIPPELLHIADICEYEAVHVWNITQGTRFETYAISGLQNSTDICVNGAAAHLASPGDKIIIASFVDIKENSVKNYYPRLIFVDENNRLLSIQKELPGPQIRHASA